MVIDSDGTLYIISDATGETAQKVAVAALIQFPQKVLRIKRFPYIKKLEEVDEVFKKIDPPGIVIFTVVDETLKSAIIYNALKKQIPFVDVLGPVLETMKNFFHQAPESIAGTLHRVNDEYFKRIEAVEFTVQHDDGAKTDNLDKSDIILVGVSRTSKTPLSVYLAHQGYKVANIPIIYGNEILMERQEKLFEKIRHLSVVGLIIDASLLQRIREERAKKIGLKDSSYFDIKEIQKELGYARRTYNKFGWPIVNVSRKAVEEVATEILSILGFI